MSASCGNLQHPFSVGLAADLREAATLIDPSQWRVTVVQRQRRLPGQVSSNVCELVGGDGAGPGEGRFVSVVTGDDQSAAGGLASQGTGKHGRDRAKGTVQGQLANKFEWVCVDATQLAAGQQYTQCDGQVEATAVLG